MRTLTSRCPPSPADLAHGLVHRRNPPLTLGAQGPVPQEASLTTPGPEPTTSFSAVSLSAFVGDLSPLQPSLLPDSSAQTRISWKELLFLCTLGGAGWGLDLVFLSESCLWVLGGPQSNRPPSYLHLLLDVGRQSLKQEPPATIKLGEHRARDEGLLMKKPIKELCF